jgi:hypothetical protein
LGRQEGFELGNSVAMDEEGEDLQLHVGALQEKRPLISVAPRPSTRVLGQKPVFAADSGPANDMDGVIVASRAVEKAQLGSRE